MPTRDIEYETRILTQEEVNEQIKNYSAIVTRQLEDLTRMIQGMSTSHWPNFSPRAGISASSSAAGPSPDSEKYRVLIDLEGGLIQLNK